MSSPTSRRNVASPFHIHASIPLPRRRLRLPTTMYCTLVVFPISYRWSSRRDKCRVQTREGSSIFRMGFSHRRAARYHLVSLLVVEALTPGCSSWAVKDSTACHFPTLDIDVRAFEMEVSAHELPQDPSGPGHAILERMTDYVRCGHARRCHVS